MTYLVYDRTYFAQSSMFAKIFLFFFLVFNLVLLNPVSAHATNLNERINQYPQWNSKISLPQPDRDLIFPDWFAGRWQVTSILEEQIAPLAPRFETPGFNQNEQYLHQIVNFDVQYIPVIELPKRDNFVPTVVNSAEVIIADRVFNGLSIAKAYLGQDNAIKVIANPNNSTEQITTFSQNNQLISTVIGRQQEQTSEEEFTTSELTSQFFRRLDNIYLNIVENTTKYHLVKPNLIEAIQVSAVYLSPKDPDYFVAIDKPVALYYYTLKLKKLPNKL